MKKSRLPSSDPVEEVIAAALDAAGIAYTRDGRGGARGQLDFRLTDLGVQIECKQFHTPRAIEQLSRFDDVILVQGLGAARALAKMIGGQAT